MHVNQFARYAVLAASALFTLGLMSPAEAQEADQNPLLVAAPIGPSWDEASGYGSVEAVRAAYSAGAPTWDELSGYHSVEASRAAIASRASRAIDLGSLQESYLFDVADTLTWDERSGYGAVEISRAVRIEPGS